MTEPRPRFGFDRYDATAFVGVAKNAGKTTALGRWLDEASSRARRSGLLSIGVDGEARDGISGVDKPSVFVPPGTFVVSGSEALSRSTARFEYVRHLGFSTPLGRVYLARVVDDGETVLGGLRYRRDVVEAVAELKDEANDGPAPHILIDGAFGRTAAADGRVTDSVVLATGAVLGRGIREIVEGTEMLVDILQLSGLRNDHCTVAEQVESRDGAAFVTAEGVREMPRSSALLGLPEMRDRWPEDVRAVVVPGAVTDGVLRELVREAGAGRTLVAMAPASIQASDEAWRTFRTTDWEVRVRDPVDLIGIAANPYGVQGVRIDGRRLLEALRQRWPTIPVFDPFRG